MIIMEKNHFIMSFIKKNYQMSFKTLDSFESYNLKYLISKMNVFYFYILPIFIN